MSFQHRLVNGPCGDPVLFVRFQWERRALLFDAGDISALGASELMRVTDVFVTHAHVDHFIGFDILLRTLLRRSEPLRVYGPADIIERVEGKLRGYTWNVIRDYPFQMEAYAIDGQRVRRVRYRAENGLKPEEVGSASFSGTLLEGDIFRVETAVLEHDIPCLGYTLRENVRLNIDRAALVDMDLPVGPWLSELKNAVRNAAPDETVFQVGGQSVRLGEVRHAVRQGPGQSLGFITDASPTGANAARISGLVKGVATLFIEAYFLEEDERLARERHHLTGALAGRIAREAGVGELVPMHFSPRYERDRRGPAGEALEEFMRR